MLLAEMLKTIDIYILAEMLKISKSGALKTGLVPGYNDSYNDDDENDVEKVEVVETWSRLGLTGEATPGST